MIPKRITTTRRVVSRLDPAWAHVVRAHGIDVYRSYCDTLDASEVLALQAPEAFTIFEVEPLKVAYEMFAGDNPNNWEIFRSHVVSASGVEIEKEHGRLTEKMRNEFGRDFVSDVADIIIKIANGDGQQLFFTHPDSGAEYLSNQLRRLARAEAMANDAELVRTAAAKANAQQ